MPLPAAQALLTAEPAFVVQPSAAAAEARRQCAAIAWTLGATYSTVAVAALSKPARTYLARIFGVTQGPGATAQVTARIDAHIMVHHPVAAAPQPPLPPPNAGGGGGGGGGGGAGGAPAGQLPGDDTGGFAAALLSAAQLTALLAIPEATLRALLDAAGVPHTPAHAGSDLRIKCAAAAWAGEKLRSTADLRALDSGIQARMLDAFEVPAAWKPDARLQAAATVLRACRDSAWALDPALSFGIVHPARSALFRLQEGISGGGASGSADPGQFLSPAEQADFAGVLATKGFNAGDLVVNQGVWSLGKSGGPPVPAPGAAVAAAQLKIETELRTLYIHPYAQLTANERKEQAARMKALPEKRKAPSYPGDPSTDVIDTGSNPFADWPWDQSLRLAPDLPYRKAGRLMRNLLRWCNPHCTCAVMKMTHDTRTKAADGLFEKFTTAITGGPSQHGHALLYAMQVVGEAKEQMQCILANAQLRTTTYPGSAMLSHIAQRREAQSLELQVFLTEISNRITAASNSVKATQGGATAAWIDFIHGWLSNEDSDLVEPASLEAANAALPPAPTSAPPTTPPVGDSASKGKNTLPGPSGGGAVGIAGSNGGAGAPSQQTKIFRFRRSIHCSADIVGTTLGTTGAPQCSRCHKGNHYNAECPAHWGGAGCTLPGFDADGARVASAWHAATNEPIRKTVKAWVAFIQDLKNYHDRAPFVAGVPGAPDLASFEARVAGAPAKP